MKIGEFTGCRTLVALKERGRSRRSSSRVTPLSLTLTFVRRAATAVTACLRDSDSTAAAACVASGARRSVWDGDERQRSATLIGERAVSGGGGERVKATCLPLSLLPIHLPRATTSLSPSHTLCGTHGDSDSEAGSRRQQRSACSAVTHGAHHSRPFSVAGGGSSLASFATVRSLKDRSLHLLLPPIILIPC